MVLSKLNTYFLIPKNIQHIIRSMQILSIDTPLYKVAYLFLYNERGCRTINQLD